MECGQVKCQNSQNCQLQHDGSHCPNCQPPYIRRQLAGSAGEVEVATDECKVAHHPIGPEFQGGTIRLGIDNGLDGGIVALDESGIIVGLHIMPVRLTGRGGERIVDPCGLDEILRSYPDAPIAAEPSGIISPGIKAVASTAQSWGVVRAILELQRRRWESIPAQRWQKILLPGRKPGETKAAALEAARRLWPGETFLATARSRKAHDGLIDAALIAEYARRSRL
jgi:hypothetical protein